MVMFKHGVAYLERGGPAQGSFELSFKKDEMNDVLKSLAVWVVRGDARIGAIAFEKPENPEEALEARRLNLQPGGALLGLLGSFRGRRVAVETAGPGPRTPAGSRPGEDCVRHEGEILGVETGHGDDAKNTLLLRTGGGGVALVDLASARAVDFLEAPSRADLEFLVDRSRAVTAGANRTVRIAVEGKAEDLRVSYVVPAPTWRVSYRLTVQDRAASGAGGDGSGTMLMAWGIVHNPADEDLDNLELVLTTGQPVSFLIDLYNPKNVRRVVVEEKSRAGAAPTQYERAPRILERPAALPRAVPPPAAHAPQTLTAYAAYPGEVKALDEETAPDTSSDGPTYVMGHSLGLAADGAAHYADRGELFEYRVASRVSLKRGGSAMVPLLASRPEAKKERIWRDGSPPSPDLVLTFKNDTGAVLEEGPAVVYDENVYAGEAMVPYSARGSEVKLAFAKDLGVRCRRTSSPRTAVSGVRLGSEALVEEQRREEHHELSAENDHAEEVEVVFELAKMSGRSLDPSGEQPFEETMSFRRFRVKVPPRGRTTAKVVERWHDARRFQYDHLSAAHLSHWLENRFLDREAFDQLAGVLAAWGQAREFETARQRVERQQHEAYAKQAKISEQLSVLKESGAEGNLRLRYVKELEAEQDKVNAAEAEMRRLSGCVEDAKKDAADKLRRVTRRTTDRPPAS
jgi:hypothetical protein